MGDVTNVVRDVKKHLTAPVIKFIDDTQKKLRQTAVKIIEVGDKEEKNNPTGLDDSSDDSSEKNKQSFALDQLRYWDVAVPKAYKSKRFGKKNLAKYFNKKRQITIELHKKITPVQAAEAINHERRVFQKLYKRASATDHSVEDGNDFPPLGDEDKIVCRILKQVKRKKGIAGLFDLEDDDSQSTASHQLPNGDLESNNLTIYDVAKYGNGHDESDFTFHWEVKYKTDISSLEINHAESLMIEIKYGIEGIKNKVYFDNVHDIETFLRTFKKMKELQHERGSRLAAEHRMRIQRKDHLLPSIGQKAPKEAFVHDPGNNRVRRGSVFGNWRKEEPLSDSVSILVEIVSATNLPIADTYTSDPYVCVQDGRKRWHTTGVVPRALNPVWALSTGSLFFIQTTLSEFFENATYVNFSVYDHDSVGKCDVLGDVLVNKKDILAGVGERVEYQLNTATWGWKSTDMIGKKEPYLTLRFRQATEEDISFLRSYEAKKKIGIMSTLGLVSSNDTGVFAEDCYLPPRDHPSKILKRQEQKPLDGSDAKHRLKPFADPSRPEAETKWMTAKRIEQETKKPSQNWIEAGSGNVGKFYLEILGCDKLPNLDFSPMGRNKSDPFVCIAFEDCVVNTDVINDCLSPRWMPWTRRAFVFNVMHPSSQLYIAVMDYEEVKGHHDKIGRCVINLTNRIPNTMYTVRYDLLNSDDVDRKVRGHISFRLRFESSTERQFLLSTLRWKKNFDVSTDIHKDSQTMVYALTNDYNRYDMSLGTIQKYVDELVEYTYYINDIVDALKIVILWRGHFPLKFSCFQKSFTFKAPVHSMLAFSWGILLSIDFDRFGSFICFWFAWILFATLESERKNPNLWKRPRTYIGLLGILLFNKSFEHLKVTENENFEEIIDFDKHRADKMKFRKETVQAMNKQNELDSKQVEKEFKELDELAHDKTAIRIGVSQVWLAPFKDILIPVQSFLYKACIYLRIATSAILWRDSVLTFWLTSILLSLSVVLFFVPWTFLFRWTFRILAFVFLGPWMKLVDIFFLENEDNMTLHERNAKVEEDMKHRYNYILGESKIRRKTKEDLMKTRDMERYMFGKYGTRVPIFKEERFQFVPLVCGSAEPYDPAGHTPPNIIRRINGQVLTGNMIPRRERLAKEFKARQKLLESQVPAFINMNSATEGEMEPLIVEDYEDENSAYGTVEC